VDLHRLLMRPFNSRRLSVLPVRGPTGPSGAVLLEDAAKPERARSFAQAVSSIAAMRIAGHDQPHETSAPSDPVEAGPSTSISIAEDTSAFSPMLTLDRVDPAGLAATYLPSVTAMNIHFDDAISLARSDQRGVTALADEIAKAMQAIATQFALPYMKLTGHSLIAAVGCTATPDPLATVRLADAALAAREACFSLLTQVGLEPVFRIGIDFGAALGCVLGQQPRLFNLWGDVIRTAEQMAQSATGSGSIQVSERAYEQLRQSFLFRARGMFYLPRIGTARIFILAGRR
jgi:class 3 adenylate cyclase